MNNVINLDAWKLKKQADELDDLAKSVSDLISDLDIDVTPSSYYSADYNDVGLSMQSGIILEPTVSSCCATLAWVSYILAGLGRECEANEIDNIVIKLENSKEK